MREERITFTIGRIFARDFRRAMRDLGLSYDEDKGWLTSHFVVTGDSVALRLFWDAAMKWNEGSA